ncbi:5'-flap endonuclease [Gnomoniopsis smithogilvyi]|uniref:Structure-specific endonuclease subunit SLX4 n=1 Tax=Gnomoniopsis smithogilvyi TaxID=1191159 RepID=A0A9W8Z458_9PEZI|nr:5'-flap endonuclease [Gnomoniopsis smithogilvyi]
MAAGDMRSPPGRPTLHDRLGILSSSPSFPDLQDLIAIKTKTKPQQMRSGSAAAAIPANASTSFTSVSDLLRIARATGDDSFDVIDEPDPPVAKKGSVKRVRKTVQEQNAPKIPKEPKIPKTFKTRKASKQVANDVIILSSDGVTPDSARRTDSIATEAWESHAADSDDVRGTPLQAKPWRKFKVPSSPESREVEEAGITPTKHLTKAKMHTNKNKSETVSRHFTKHKEHSADGLDKLGAKEKRPRASTPEATNLEPALQRRMDWTPAKADTLIPRPSPDIVDTQEALQSGEAGSGAIDLFKNLHDTYGHKAIDAGVAAAPEQHFAQVLGKRRVINMVSVDTSSKSTEASRAPSPDKVKAPKKKPRTITELATAAYAARTVGDDAVRDDSLLEYFTVENSEQHASKSATARGKGKGSRVTKSKKKAAPKKPVLLSPQSAMRQSAAQNFVFGTSSQLAREKSPGFLDAIHAAMKASTIAEEDDPLASPLTKVESQVRGKGLWSVSARDEQGEVVDIEMIDMVDSPALPQDDAILDPWTQLPPEPGSAETGTADSSVIELDSRPIAPNRSLSPQQPTVPNSQKMTLNAAAAILPKQFSDESFPLVTELLEDEMPPPSNQQQTQEEVRDSPNRATASAQKSRPKYETFTDVKLAKEISKFGFKAVKTRTGMIALLDQCWKRKSQVAAAGAAFSTSSLLASPKRKKTDGTSETSVKSPPVKKLRGRAKATVDADSIVAGPSTEALHTSPKKKQGRPRKNAAAVSQAASAPPKHSPGPSTPKRRKAAVQAELVVKPSDLDSEIESSASAPEHPFSPSGGSADVTIEDTEISLNLSATAQQSTLFRHITKAVISAPRTADPENPSWHEKILMYDPVILEDLTAWLNSGELTKLGYDDEVSPQDVKKWCELRSICCLWKGNWHGKERKRF